MRNREENQNIVRKRKKERKSQWEERIQKITAMTFGFKAFTNNSRSLLLFKVVYILYFIQYE